MADQMVTYCTAAPKIATVLGTNNEELRVVTCISCAELELELEKTKIELRSALRIVEMMKEDIAKDLHMASGNSEGIQIHTNRQRKEKKEANKLRDHSETYASPRNS
jgi:hypothetical protein